MLPPQSSSGEDDGDDDKDSELVPLTRAEVTNGGNDDANHAVYSEEIEGGECMEEPERGLRMPSLSSGIPGIERHGAPASFKVEFADRVICGHYIYLSSLFFFYVFI